MTLRFDTRGLGIGWLKLPPIEETTLEDIGFHLGETLHLDADWNVSATVHRYEPVYYGAPQKTKPKQAPQATPKQAQQTTLRPRRLRSVDVDTRDGDPIGITYVGGFISFLIDSGLYLTHFQTMRCWKWFNTPNWQFAGRKPNTGMVEGQVPRVKKFLRAYAETLGDGSCGPYHVERGLCIGCLPCDDPRRKGKRFPARANDGLTSGTNRMNSFSWTTKQQSFPAGTVAGGWRLWIYNKAGLVVSTATPISTDTTAQVNLSAGDYSAKLFRLSDKGENLGEPAQASFAVEAAATVSIAIGDVLSVK